MSRRLELFHFPALDDQVKPYFGPPQEGVYYCNACGSTQRSQSNMMCHVESKHLNLNLKCVFCPSISKTRRYFRAHLNYHHKDKLPTYGLKDFHYYTME